MKETPETDRIYNEEWNDRNPETLASLMIDHAERMERERDEAREEARKTRIVADYLRAAPDPALGVITFPWEGEQKPR